MDIYRLYQLIKMWEVALTLTKPRDITKVSLRPVINKKIEYCGEGQIYGTIEFTLERKDTYTKFNIIDIYKEYKDFESCKKNQEEMVLCLIDYLEQFLNNDAMDLVWENVNSIAMDWYEKPPI